MLFFGVAWHASEAECRAYIDEFDVPYASGLDTQERVFRAYRFTYQPGTVFVTRSGQVLRRHFGPLEARELDGYVRDLIATA